MVQAAGRCTFDISGQGELKINHLLSDFSNSLHFSFKRLSLCQNGVIGQHAARAVKKAFKPEHVLVQVNVLASIQANSQIQKSATMNVSSI